MLLASHNMSEVERLCERVIIMKRRVEDDDTPQRLLISYGHEDAEEVFLDVVRGRGELVRRRNDRSRSFDVGQHSRQCRHDRPFHQRCDIGSAPGRGDGAALSLCCARRGPGWSNSSTRPAVQLLVWDFLPALHRPENSGFFARASGLHRRRADADVLFRGQLGFSVSFLEEMIAQYFSNLMISPLHTRSNSSSP